MCIKQICVSEIFSFLISSFSPKKSCKMRLGSWLNGVLIFLSVAVIKIMIKSNTGGNKLFHFDIPGHNPLREVRTKTQSRNSRRSHGALAAYWLGPHNFLSLFSDTTHVCMSRGITVHPELGPQ